MSERNPLPYCLAHLAQLNPVAAWQPIETAPKDGTIIPCCWDRRIKEDGPWPLWAALRWKHNHRTNREYFGDPEEDDDYELADDQPTHWFKMPEPPSQPGKIRCMRCGFEGSKAEFDEHLAPTDDPRLHIGRVVS